MFLTGAGREADESGVSAKVLSKKPFDLKSETELLLLSSVNGVSVKGVELREISVELSLKSIFVVNE